MVWIIVISVCIFAFRTLVLFFYSVKERNKEVLKIQPSSKNFVSVIVPARNEENNIEDCINHIMLSDYPSELFEVVAVNDRSYDKTGEILDALSDKFANLRIIHINNDSEKGNLKGKPGALHIGILGSKGDIVMMTDADCTVNPEWISSISEIFNNSQIGLVPSYTLVKGERAFDKFQAVEWIYMHTMASAGVAMNNPLGCFGNNLSIRRSVYDEIGGFAKIKFSVTEDLALLKAVFKSGHKVNYLCSYKSAVTTAPCLTYREFISQHKRWAVGGIDLGYNAVFFVVTSLAIWIGLVVAIVSLKPVWILALLFTRIIGDYIIIKPAMNILRQNHLHSWIIASVAFVMLSEIIVPPLLLDKRVNWKGQVFGKNN